MTTRPRVLVAGVSVRALARSALAAGYDVLAIDAFADRDLVELFPQPVAHYALAPFTARTAARLGATLDADAIAYASGFENDPRAIEMLAMGRPIWGCSPSTVAEIRNPREVQEALSANPGCLVPPVFVGETPPVSRAGRFLHKPIHSGGGHGISLWQGEPLEPEYYLQEFVAGIPGSAICLADGRGQCAVLGLSRQLVGEAAFGAHGFQYCGSLIGVGVEARVLPDADVAYEHALRAAAHLSRRFGLRGLFCLDFVATDDFAAPIEVNPRASASMELIERHSGTSLFALHVAACQGDLKPALDLTPSSRGVVLGKAIVYAPHDVRIPNTDSWLADPSLADIPQSDAVIRGGAPICTVFASAATSEACRLALASRAAELLSACAQHAGVSGWVKRER